ncbi:MAG: hypothetical protein LQ348_004137 [Seirophora lacunosa]|nr:MAG: hypothetical protein LQ348_004137 [Seirophora lacunosa]
MTHSRLGLFFSNYEYNFSNLRNTIIEQTLMEAAQKINDQLASNPDLANQALDGKWVYLLEEQEYLLELFPDIPKMTKPPKMPGGRGGTFSYNMTPDKPFGLIFSHYDYLSTFDNDVIEQTFAEATDQIYRELAPDPALANQTVNVGWEYSHLIQGTDDDYYHLSLFTDGPSMTYGDIPVLLAVLETWAREYRTVECDFEIFVRPGTEAQRRFGNGLLMFVF